MAFKPIEIVINAKDNASAVFMSPFRAAYCFLLMNMAKSSQTKKPARQMVASAANSIPQRGETPAATKKAMQKKKTMKRAMCAFYEKGFSWLA